jgi:hypothetical protein
MLFNKNNLIENKYMVDNLAEGKYYWRVAAQNIIEKSEWSQVDSFNVTIPTSVTEHMSSKISFYPKPVMDNGIFNYPTGKSVRVEFYDIAGTLVRTIADQDRNGETQVDFIEMNPGVYMYRLVDEDG